MRPTRIIFDIACLVASLPFFVACAHGNEFDGSGGSGGSGTSSTTKGSSTSSKTSATVGTTGAGPTTTVGPSSVASTGTGTGCAFLEHMCNGTCEGNTVDSGCYQSVTCAPCPMPTNGSVMCSSGGQCQITCNMGYQINATQTDCDAIPPPPTCCDDSECAIFTVCLDGYCKFPLGATCDPAQCNIFCQCKVGGTPQSMGMCVIDVVPTCECTP